MISSLLIVLKIFNMYICIEIAIDMMGIYIICIQWKDLEAMYASNNEHTLIAVSKFQSPL